MSEYLIQGDILTAMANQVRRISGTDETFNVVQIVDMLQRSTGSIGETSGEYAVQALDYDGNVIKSSQLDSGMVFTFPTVPNTPEGYVTKWSSSEPIHGNYLIVSDSDITVLPTYDTASGAVELTTISLSNVVLPWMIGISYVDWGDGTTTTWKNPDYHSTSHTYDQEGVYTIKVYGATEIYGSSTGTQADYFSSILLPRRITAIKNNTFRNFTHLKKIGIHDGITSIGEGAFINCEGLINVIIPDGITSIPSYAFSSAGALKSVTLPDSITSIGYEAFVRCSSLTNINIPDGVTSISYNAFKDCTSLKSITIPSGISSLGTNTYGDIFAKTGITSLRVPGNVKTIGNGTFSLCLSLTDVVLENGVTSIEERAFSNCRALQTIRIPASVTNIGHYAFCDCGSLKSAVYEGTAEEWANVTVGWNGNEDLTNILTFAG